MIIISIILFYLYFFILKYHYEHITNDQKFVLCMLQTIDTLSRPYSMFVCH